MSIQGYRFARIEERKDIAAYEDGEHGFLYRPGQLLAAAEDAERVEAEIAQFGGERERLVRAIGVVRYRLPEDVDVPALVTRLRAQPRGRPLRASANHVFSGEPFYKGGPADFPAPQPNGTAPAGTDGGGVRVGVFDTGFARKVEPWLDAQTDTDADDAEELDVFPPSGALDGEAGHGTFICGVVLQRAPAARVRAQRVLDSEGYADEVQLVDGILPHVKLDVLNLSLGGYTQDDLPPLALGRALRRVPASSAIVAAAGNNSSKRPFWPAAFKRVIAVGGVEGSGRRAPFSNFGWWVDVSAPAVEVVSTFPRYAESVEAVAGRGPQAFAGWAAWSGTSFATPKVAGEIAAEKTRRGLPSAREAAVQLLSRPGLPELPGLGVILSL